MKKKLADFPELELLDWSKDCIEERCSVLSHGNQGFTYVLNPGPKQLLIKAPSRHGLSGLVQRWMLHKEFNTYSRLAGMRGIPQCYGFAKGRYLILEYVHGKTIREAGIADQETFFKELFELVSEMHRRGVAHGDMKRKENILVVDGSHPCLVDFGVSVVYKRGFAPLNHCLFALFKTWDYNAWVKLKYNRKISSASAEDRQFYRRTLIECLAHWTKASYRKVTRWMIGVKG